MFTIGQKVVYLGRGNKYVEGTIQSIKKMYVINGSVVSENDIYTDENDLKTKKIQEKESLITKLQSERAQLNTAKLVVKDEETL